MINEYEFTTKDEEVIENAENCGLVFSGDFDEDGLIFTGDDKSWEKYDNFLTNI